MSIRFLAPLAAALIAATPALCEAAPAAPAAPASAAPRAKPARAKNVILFLADAAGVSVFSAASLHGYGEPMRLNVQKWPHLALSETSPVDAFVSDSANGMSAIVTGVKTRNGVISQDATAVRGKTDGAPTKTILEYAEARGLKTAVITSQSIADATPAAAYAHANDRGKWGEIFPQAFAPRFGDGVDVLIGAGRDRIGEQLAARGTSFDALAAAHKRPIYASLDAVPADEARPVVVADEVDVRDATLKALDRLQGSKAGYLMVIEWDAHTDEPKEGLDRLVAFDKLAEEVRRRVDLEDTLLIFTADHSFALNVFGGKRGEPLMEGYDAWKAANPKGQEEVRLKNLFVVDTHTAEEVPVLADGPGANLVRGYLPNTRLFEIMMHALGWKPDAPKAAPKAP